MNLSDFPYEYYFFGSEDSTDTDVLINYTHQIQKGNENRLLKNIEDEFPVVRNWDKNLIKVKNGRVVFTINSKGSCAGVNNSLYYTYDLHEQSFPNPVTHIIKRNLNDDIRRYEDFVLTLLKHDNQVFYKERLRPALKSRNKRIQGFKDKIYNAHLIFNDYVCIRDGLSNDNLKKVTFYAIQMEALFEGIEIYTKKGSKERHPKLSVFLDRTKHNNDDLHYLKHLLDSNCNLIFKSK